MKTGSILKFILIAGFIGALIPMSFSICFTGTTLQAFVLAPPPPGGFWSGAPTPVPTPIPSEAQIVTAKVLSSGGGSIFILWSMLGAFIGEGLAVWRWGKTEIATRSAWLGAILGCLAFFVLGLMGLPR